MRSPKIQITEGIRKRAGGDGMKSLKVRITESIVDVLLGAVGVATLAGVLYLTFVALYAIV